MTTTLASWKRQLVSTTKAARLCIFTKLSERPSEHDKLHVFAYSARRMRVSVISIRRPSGRRTRTARGIPTALETHRAASPHSFQRPDERTIQENGTVQVAEDRGNAGWRGSIEQIIQDRRPDQGRRGEKR